MRVRLFVLCLLGPAFCQGAPGRPPGDLSHAQPAETQAMIERIDAAWRESDPLTNWYLASEAVAPARQRMRNAESFVDLFNQQLPYWYLLNAGKTEEAIEDQEKFELALGQLGSELPPVVQQRFSRFKAVAHLRWGEQLNCLKNHNADSCIFPIQGGGVHADETGSRTALIHLHELLRMNPRDLEARWLLNIAHMTLGEYPGGVPAEWLIPVDRFDANERLPRFGDVAGALGVGVDDLAGGVVMEDFDNDHHLDLLVTGSGPDSQIRLFRNQGDGSFTDRTAEAGLTGLTGGLHAVQADIDNDGFLDVLVLRTGWLTENPHPNSLLRNNGDFTFTDVTEAAGMLSEHPTQTAAWFDYDGDGWIDLFIGNESFGPDRVHPCELYRNNGDGTFVEVAETGGLAVVANVKGVTAGDFNNDGRPDLYLSIIGAPNRLYRNEGPGSGAESTEWRFTEVATVAGVTEPDNSFPTWWWDYDNDGWLDLMVMGYQIGEVGDIAADYLGLPTRGEKPRLYRNNGDETFTDVTLVSGMDTILRTMGCNFGDLDNDGWLDFYAGTGDPEFSSLMPSRMFRGTADGRFQDVTTSGGFGQLQKGHGIAWGDIDQDGDQDIYSVVGGAFPGDNYPNQLFVNLGHDNHWLKLQLVGSRSNRAAIGARIEVVVRSIDETERSLHRVVTSGTSFGSSSVVQEIGLGQAAEVVSISVVWPASGIEQEFAGPIDFDRKWIVREDRAELVAVQPIEAFELPVSNSLNHGHRHP